MSTKRLTLLLALCGSLTFGGFGSMADAADNDAQDAIDAADAITLVNEQVGAKKYDEGLATVTAYLKKHPDFTQFYLQKGYILLKLKRYDEALTALYYCTKAGYAGIGQKGADSLNAEARMFIGHCKLAKGDQAGAKEAFKKGLALYPDMEKSLAFLQNMPGNTGLAAIAADRMALFQIAKVEIAK